MTINNELSYNNINKSIKSYYRRLCTTITIRKSLLYISVVLTLLYSLHRVYIESYLWQSTQLADYIHTNKRNQCILTSNLSIYHPNSEIKYKIGMISLYDDFDGSLSNNLMNRLINNRINYCHKYNYTFILANHLIDRSKPIAWSKLLAVKKYLPSYDYLMYIDIDVVIMNSNISIEYFLSNSPIDKDFIMTKDWNGLNTGVWLVKNTNWSLQFLDLAWNQNQLVSKYSNNGISHPFEYEQRAFHYLLQTDKWTERKLPKYLTNDQINEIRNHFYYLPQCSFNSYSLHPFDRRGQRYDRQYVDGDFLIHFAGKKGEIKTNLIKYYLNEADS